MKSKTIYGIPISNPKPNETAVFRNPLTLKEFITTPSPEIETMQDLMLSGLKKWENEELLGTKPLNSHEYQFKTWGQCHAIAKNIGSGIINEKLITPINEEKNETLNFLGIESKNREEWIFCDWASQLYGFTIVPFFESLGLKSIAEILNETNLQTIACSRECLESFIKENDLGKLKNIICFDKIDSQIEKELAWRNLKFIYLPDLIEIGKKNTVNAFKNIQKSDIYSITYTSGTTGVPKGAILTHGNMVAGISVHLGLGEQIQRSDRYLSYLPVAHIFERIMLSVNLSCGSRIGFESGNIHKIKEDMQDLKPTLFCSAPRLENRFYEILKNNFKQEPFEKKFLFEKAMQKKYDKYTKEGILERDLIWDTLVFKNIRSLFGGCINVLISGSAPISKEVVDFLKIIFGCNFIDGYGITEAMVVTGSNFNDLESGHIGGPTVITELKVVDVPEMKFYSKEKQGELVVRGPGVCEGYEKNEIKTKEVFEEQGWYHTGDIVELNERGFVKIIDRKKNIFKLANGEEVAPEKLENLYQSSKAVEEAFVEGDSSKSFLVGIFVAKRNFIEEKAKELGIEYLPEEKLLGEEKIKKSVKKELDEVAHNEKLISFERVSKFHLISESFNTLGLTTSTFKLKRYEAKQYFNGIIEELCKKLTAEEKNEK